MAGDTCDSRDLDLVCFPAARTLQEAMQVCAADGRSMRLCTVAEVEGSVCCSDPSSACGADSDRIWTSTPNPNALAQPNPFGVTEPSCATAGLATINPPEAFRTYSGIYNGDSVGTGYASSALNSAQGWRPAES